MAITKILYINSSPKGAPTTHLVNSIDYILNPRKTKNGLLTGSLNCDKDNAFQDMMDTKEFYGKTDLRQGYHIMISFSPGEADEETAMDIVRRFAQTYLGEKYECVYAVHNDKGHMHGHIVFNSVSCLDGRKYHYADGDWAKEIQPVTNSLCEEYGLEIINVNEKGLKRYENYGEWKDAMDHLQPANFEKMRADIDEAVIASVNMEELTDYLEIKGYKVKLGKHMTLCPKDRQRGTRTYRLGYAYTPEALEKRLAGEDYELSTYSVSDVSEKRYEMQRAGYHIKGTHGINSKNQYSLYREDIRKLQKIQRVNNYLVKHRIRTMEDLSKRVARLEASIDTIDQERSGIFQERGKHREAIHILRTDDGETDVAATLRRMGYVPEEIRRFEIESSRKLEELRKMKRSIGFELRTCKEVQPNRLIRTK